MLIGYARTFTTDEAAELAAQENELRGFGAERVFTEQVSVLANRPVLKVCLAFLREGDHLVVTKPDRLAASVTDLLAIIADLDKRNVGLVIRSIGRQPLDTRFPAGKEALTLLVGIACWEHEILLERQRDIPQGKSQGRSKGRPSSINLQEIKVLVGTMSVTEIARKLNISRSSAYRVLRQAPRRL